MGIYYLFCYFEKQPPGVSAMPWPSTDDEMVMMKLMMMMMMMMEIRRIISMGR